MGHCRPGPGRPKDAGSSPPGGGTARAVSSRRPWPRQIHPSGGIAIMAKRPIPTAKTKKLMESILTGMPKLPATLTSISVLGKTYTMAEFMAQVQVYKGKFDTTDQAHAAAKAADEDVQKIAPEANQ